MSMLDFSGKDLGEGNEHPQQKAAISEGKQITGGCFLAVVSQNDVSTPFWIAQVVALPKGNASKSKEIRVRWFQASGSASDPYDAAYIPSVRKRGNNGEITYWESSVHPSEVIIQFESLTSEKRIDNEIVRELKANLYQ